MQSNPHYSYCTRSTVCSYSCSIALMILSISSSISRALRAGKGLFNPCKSTIGSSTPLTLTMKFPLPGFSLLISTFAFEPTPFVILAARVRNAPQDLQCSMVTTFPTKGDEAEAEVVSIAASDVFSASTTFFRGFFAIFFLVTVGFLTGSSTDFPPAACFLADDLVTLAMIRL